MIHQDATITTAFQPVSIRLGLQCHSALFALTSRDSSIFIPAIIRHIFRPSRAYHH